MGLSEYANIAQILSIIPIAATVIFYKIHNCKVPWCWRVAKNLIPGTDWKVCSRHNTKDKHHRLFHLYGRKHEDSVFIKND